MDHVAPTAIHGGTRPDRTSDVFFKDDNLSVGEGVSALIEGRRDLYVVGAGNRARRRECRRGSHRRMRFRVMDREPFGPGLWGAP
jgi:hypothetical protein